jgi:hypothetical protein
MERWTAREPTDPKPTLRNAVTIVEFSAEQGYFRQFLSTGEAQNWIAELRMHIDALKKIIEFQSQPLKPESFDF